jgi:hypothetical protein
MYTCEKLNLPYLVASPISSRQLSFSSAREASVMNACFPLASSSFASDAVA